MINKNFKIIEICDLLDSDVPNIQYLIDDIIMKGGLTYFVGQSGSFKTGILMKAVVCGATATKFLHKPIKNKFNTLWIDEENGKVVLKAKTEQIVNGHSGIMRSDLKNKTFFSIIEGFTFHPTHIKQLHEIIKTNQIDLVVIDSIARTLIGNESDSKDVNKILGMIKPIMEEGTAFAIIHHTRKGSEGTLDDIAGSRDFAAMADYVYLSEYERTTDVGKQFKFKCLKSRVTEGSMNINFLVQGTKDKLGVSYVGTTQDAIKDAQLQKQQRCTTAILQHIKDHSSIKTYRSSELIKQFKRRFSESLIRRSIADLTQIGELKKEKRGVYSVSA